jgi:hypothetical protein
VAEDKRKEEENKKASEKKADEEKKTTTAPTASTASTALTVSTASTVVKDELEDESLETAKPKTLSEYSRPKPKSFKCPLCDAYKGTDNCQAFRLHFFLHYKDRWSERVSADPLFFNREIVDFAVL